jgi:hypothetical protein
MRTICNQFVAASLCEAPVFAQDVACDRAFPPRRPQGGGYSCGKEHA